VTHQLMKPARQLAWHW